LFVDHLFNYDDKWTNEKYYLMI